MYCKNCGVNIDENNQMCQNCGAPVGCGNSHCQKCGAIIGNSKFCNECGAPNSNFKSQSHGQSQNMGNESGEYTSSYSTPRYDRPGADLQKPKSRLIAGLLAIFVGFLGIHNFYLGNNNIGLAQVLASTIGGMFTCGIATVAIQIWATVEGILILIGKIDHDAYGNPLAD